MNEDKELVCVGSVKSKGCGRTFVWTEGEQDFMGDLYEEGKIKELNAPTRCPECREKRNNFFLNKQRRNDQQQY